MRKKAKIENDEAQNLDKLPKDESVENEEDIEVDKKRPLNRFNSKKKRMLRALEKTMCIVTTAARMARINPATHYYWLNTDEAYASEVEILMNKPLDLAESKLLKAIEEGQIAAIIFYLKCKGKKRGYVERQEIVEMGDIEVDFREL